MFSIESSHSGDSNEYTQYIKFIFFKKKITLNYPRYAGAAVAQRVKRWSTDLVVPGVSPSRGK